MSAVLMAAAAVGGELGPLVQQVQTEAVEMAVPVLTTQTSSELMLEAIVEDLLVAVQARATEMTPLHLPPAALEGEAQKAAATIPQT
jgi:hypothetical protein